MRTAPRMLTSLAPVALLLACVTESQGPTYRIQAMSFANSEWSAPVNLGTPINTPANEQGPALSKDGLTLYFGSDRTGGFGSFDLYISRRGCRDCPWEAPVNLGPTVNTATSETGPSLSIDGHLLFFTSLNRPGGKGLQDLYVSRHADPQNDLGWGPPVALGPGVNTAASEAGAEYLQNAEEGTANSYFNRAPPTGAGSPADPYYASLTRDGETLGPAVLIAELSDPLATDQGATCEPRRTDEFAGRGPTARAVVRRPGPVLRVESVGERWGHRHLRRDSHTER